MIENAQDFLKALFGERAFFGGATRGQQASSPKRGLLLTALVSLIAGSGRPVRVLEVGSWVGLSALTWAHAVDRFCPEGGSVLCVDPWASYLSQVDVASGDAYREMDQLASTEVAYELFRHNAGTGPARVPIEHRRGKATDILRTLPAASFDIVYIDGSHYYAEVKADLIEAKRLVAEGGIVAGDDLEMQLGPLLEPTIRANLERDFISLPNGIRCHPGVTLAVAEEFGRVSTMGGAWYMRRAAGGFLPVSDFSGARMLIPVHWPTEMKLEAKGLLAGQEELSR